MTTTEEPDQETADAAGLADLERMWADTSDVEKADVCAAVDELGPEIIVSSWQENGDSLPVSEEAFLDFWDRSCAQVAAAEPAEADGPETFQVGDTIERPTATLVVNTLEQRDSISMPNGLDDMPANLTPDDGERLWYVDITWTNNLPEVVSKECHGPYAMDMRAYDLQGREMMMIDQPGFIEGQNCSTGLMQGQTGTWRSGFHSFDEEFGWLEFNDYNGDTAVVVLDPAVEVTYVD